MRLDDHNRILIPYSTLVPVVFSASWFKQSVSRRKIDKVGRGGRGNSVEIVYDTMSEHYKDKIKAVLGDPRKLLGLTAERQQKGVIERIPFNELKPAQLRECNAKYNLVKAFRHYAEVNGSEIGVVASKKEFVRMYEDGYLEVETKQILGSVSFQTLERWNKDLRDGGEVMDALAPAKRDNTQVVSVSPEQQAELIRLYLNPNRPTIAEVFREARRTWRYKGVTEIPSETASRRFINSWADDHHDFVTFYRYGEKTFKETCMPHLERDPNKIKYLDVLVSDGRVMNFQIINPSTGKLCRPTLVAWIDARTLQILGFELSVTENTLAVASAFRMACLNAGRLLGVEGAVIPRSIYVDNGRAYKNKALGNGNKKSTSFDKDNSTIGLFERLKPYGLQHAQYAKAYNGRTKIIERIWQFFDELDRYATTYVGKSITDKPASLARNEVYHKTNRAKAIETYGYPTLWGAYEMISAFLGEYNNRPGNGKYLDGFTPMELSALQSKQIDLSGRTLAVNELNYMMMHSQVRKVTGNGVRINGISYYNPIMSTIAGSGQECIVKFDLRNRDSVLIFREDETFWCEATPFIGQNLHPMAALGSDIDKAHLSQALATQTQLTNEAKKRAISVKTEGATLELPFENNNSFLPIPNAQLPMASAIEEPKYRLF